MKKLFWLSSVMILYFYCAPQPVQPATPEGEEVVIIGEEETTPEEKFVTEEPIVVGEEEPLPSPLSEETFEEEEVAVAPVPSMKVPPPPSPTKVYGYRIQIIALDASKPGNKEKAQKYAQEAEARLKGEHKAYVEYIPPYYKVRVGDFISREEAEKMKMRLRSLGYYDAWVVETEIIPKR